MPKNVVQYNLLISCPGDIINEIGIIENAVSQFNTRFSDALGISVRLKHWRKNSYAQSEGEPQALLNRQFVNHCRKNIKRFRHFTINTKIRVFTLYIHQIKNLKRCFSHIYLDIS